MEWPTNKLSGTNITVIVGCLSDDPAAPILARSLEGKPARPIKLMFLKERDDPRACHLLFISRAPMLTMREVDQFVHRGWHNQLHPARANVSVRNQCRSG